MSSRSSMEPMDSSRFFTPTSQEELLQLLLAQNRLLTDLLGAVTGLTALLLERRGRADSSDRGER